MRSFNKIILYQPNIKFVTKLIFNKKYGNKSFKQKIDNFKEKKYVICIQTITYRVHNKLPKKRNELKMYDLQLHIKCKHRKAFYTYPNQII